MKLKVIENFSIYFNDIFSGVGMYQHDIKEARLAKTLNDIVTECVSFVGKRPFFKYIS